MLSDLVFFFYVQVIANSSQGWVNAILFVFLSKKMRQRIFWQPLRRLAKKTRKQRREPPARPRSLPGHGKPSSEGTPLFQETAAETARGYDTHYSFPTEFDPTSLTTTRPELIPVRAAPANVDMEFSTIGGNETTYTPYTDIAST